MDHERPEDTHQEHERRQQQALSIDRRRMLLRAGAALGGLTVLLLGAPITAFLMWPVRRVRSDVWRQVGRVDDFPIGETVKVTYPDVDDLPWAGDTEESAAYVRRTGAEDFTAFSIHCTHTGCPVRYLAGARLFFCPCHGGVFHDDGSIAAGPPPLPLPRHQVRVRDGRVEVLTRAILREGGEGAP